MNTMTQDSINTAPASAATAFSRPAALAGGALALILATAFATTLLVKGGGGGADKAAGAVAVSPVALMGSADTNKPGVPQAPMDAPEREANKLPMITEKAAPPSTQASPKPAPKTTHDAPSRGAATSTASVCSNCGVVQSVTPVKQKGEGTGVGAVGGAVVGGLLGGQMGSGNGKKAMTVIGAVGGGMAGHEIEKQVRATTVYRVTVRMNDGSTQTTTQSTPPGVGQKVTVSGGQARVRA